MFNSTRKQAVIQIQRLKSLFFQKEELPFGDILAADFMLKIVEETAGLFRDRVFSPVVTLTGICLPFARLVVLISLASGSVLDCALGPWRGKETGEHALLRQILGSLDSGDILVADRYYCSFFLIAMLKITGIDVVFQNHTKRRIDFRRGERLGKKDHIVKWSKPARPE